MTTRKLVKSVVSGRVSRVKRILREEKRRLVEEDASLAHDDAWMDEVRVRSRDHCYGDKTYLLHLAAAIGDERVLRFLLKSGFAERQGTLRQRGDLQTPLHLAISRCQRTLKSHRGNKGAIEDFQDFVKPILDASPEALKVKNQLGQRGSSVLDELQADIARVESGKGDGDDDRDVDHVKDDDDDVNDDNDNNYERKWREKLRDECMFETDSTIGRFREGQYYWQEDDERGRETFREFAERIEREYQARFERVRRRREEDEERKKEEKKGKSASSSSSSKLGKEIDLEKRKQYEEMRRVMTLKNRKLDYERRWEAFFKEDSNQGDRRYGFEEIPWPKIPEERPNKGETSRIKKLVTEMLDISTFTVSAEDKERERRLEIKRWHPDKVMQKIRVKEEDADMVALVVKELAQALNSLRPQ